MLTLIDDGRPVELPAAVAGGRVHLRAEALEAALGWALTPDGLCLDAVCVPVPPGSSLVGPAGVDLGELAALLERPLALDLEEGAAYLGGAARDRREALAALEAPDFELPDQDGRLHRLSAQRGKKVFLVAWASW